MKRSILFSVAFCMLSFMTVHAQSIPVNTKYGKVSREEVEMTSYQLDTSAVALVLYEDLNMIIDFNATGGFSLVRKKHMRIKILKEEGLDWGDVALLTYVTPQHKETVSGIEVVTYNMVDGKIVETKMPKKYVFTEDYSEKYKKVSFSAQEVRVGSVIEIKYDFISSMYWEIDNIFFQKSIPVNYAECAVRIPEMFTFNKKMMGTHPVEHHLEYENAGIPTGGGTYAYTVNVDKFKYSDMPAFKHEPYLFNADQYHSQVKFDIRSLFISGSVHEDFGVTWADVDETYLDSDLMLRFKAKSQFKEELAAIASETDDAARIAAVVKLVQEKVQWNKRYNIVPDPLAQVVKAQSGASSDLNCLAAGCLRDLGFTVNPVLVKMRSSGVLLDYQPERAPFDTFILSVAGADGTTYYVDAASPDGYVNVLNPLFLISNARVLRENGQSGWVDISKLSRNGTVISVNAALGKDMRLEGSLTYKATGEEMFTLKREYKSHDKEEDFISEIENDNSLEIEEFTQKGMKEYTSSAEYTCKFSKDLEATPERVYINPFMIELHSKDAFKSIERTYPIDFPYPHVLNYMIIIPIPEGYAVEEVPSNSIIKLDCIGATMKLMCSANATMIQMVYNYRQDGVVGLPENYADIREFWEHLNKLMDSMIIFKKI